MQWSKVTKGSITKTMQRITMCIAYSRDMAQTQKEIGRRLQEAAWFSNLKQKFSFFQTCVRVLMPFIARRG